MTIQHWFVDFDDTLVKARMTWVLEDAFPRLIQQHQLNYDAGQFNQAVFLAQAESNTNLDALSLLKGIFTKLEWPESLMMPFLEEMQVQYQPECFDDALPFLQHLQQRGKTVYILSNNSHSKKQAEQFGLLPYVEAVLTPDNLPGTPRKPDIKVWEALRGLYPHLTEQAAVIVGDDPWSEGTFAETCGLSCWLVDRQKRYTSLYNANAYHWVQSLLDIPIESGSRDS